MQGTSIPVLYTAGVWVGSLEMNQNSYKPQPSPFPNPTAYFGAVPNKQVGTDRREQTPSHAHLCSLIQLLYIQDWPPGV